MSPADQMATALEALAQSHPTLVVVMPEDWSLTATRPPQSLAQLAAAYRATNPIK